ncbi:MAG TPA: FtsK/SpoIIIE domain-containing protein [Jatrophihabitans sp.]|nr:FtsK/SpoIIIE domain-containing protein [Jatrophihabitans sp.]
MRINLTLVDGQGSECDIAVQSRRPAPWQRVLERLRELGLIPTEAQLFTSGGLVGDRAMLGEPGLRSGCVLRTVRPAMQSDPTGVLLRVESGPDSGKSYALSRGSHVVGRAQTASIQLDDPDLSRHHLCFEVGLHSVTVRDLGSTNGSQLGQITLTEQPHPVPVDRMIVAGRTRFVIQGVTEPPAATQQAPDGKLLVHRPPRTTTDWQPTELVAPNLSEQNPRPKLSWVAAVVPAATAVVLAAAFRSVQMLALAAMSPLSLVASMAADRRAWSRTERERRRNRSLAGKALAGEVEAALAAEEHALHRQFPGPAVVLHAAGLPDCRLWERRLRGHSELHARVGLADQFARTTMRTADRTSSAGELRAVPATVALSAGPVGLAGPRAEQLASARFVVAQLLALHSPNDLDVICLFDPCSEADWRWLRWCDAHVKAVATSGSARMTILQELNRIAESTENTAGPGAPTAARWTVLIIDPADKLGVEPGYSGLLEHTAANGITALCLSAQVKSLPAWVRASFVLEHAAAGCARLRAPECGELEVWPDGVSAAWAEEFSRALSPLTDAEATGRRIPLEQRLTELLNLDELTSKSIATRWDRNWSGPTPVGMGSGKPWTLDLVKDGPHVLIAGTTGAGKSELLRSLVTALACDHGPDRLSFVLIDYKGGAAFAECAEFPHVLGLVTDLDSQLTKRALISLEAELQSRERAFADAGVSDLESFHAQADQDAQPLTRLVLVIDEFATLAEELPDFLDGLLGVAQRGRSLGVHLILATQRPSGVLSQDIKANMSLRVALRVTDASESIDVINDDRAYRISRSTPGRAVARSADGELTEFQAARVTLPTLRPDQVHITPLDAWNRAVALPADDVAETELAELQRCFVQAARHRRFPNRPWLDPLPPFFAVSAVQHSTRLSLGVLDIPGEQAQRPLTHDLAEGGSLAIIGAARSGRTAAARTTIGLAVAQLPGADLHVYVLDCGGGGLAPARQLPHCGTYADLDDPARLALLVQRLGAELAARNRRLSASGVGSAAEARAQGQSLPHILVVLDGWDSFTAADEELTGGRGTEQFLRLMRQAPAAGFSIVVTGDRQLLSPKVSSAAGRKLVLPLADAADYSLAGIRADAMPTTSRPGHGVLADEAVEFQLGLFDAAAESAAQWQAIRAAALDDGRIGEGAPIRLAALPERVDLSMIGSPSTGVRLGMGGDEAGPVDCDVLGAERRFLIAGPSRSGKSTAARLIAEQVRQLGVQVSVAAPARSPLRSWAGQHQLAVIDPSDRRLVDEGEFLVVDDAEAFSDTEVGDRLAKIVATGDIPVVIAARTDDLLVTFRGLGAEIRRHRTGVLLQPAQVDGELLGVRISREHTTGMPGRGLLVTDRFRHHPGGTLPIQLAMP